MLIAHIFHRPFGAQWKNTKQLAKYPGVSYVKPSKKMYVRDRRLVSWICTRLWRGRSVRKTNQGLERTDNIILAVLNTFSQLRWLRYWGWRYTVGLISYIWSHKIREKRFRTTSLFENCTWRVLPVVVARHVDNLNEERAPWWHDNSTFPFGKIHLKTEHESWSIVLTFQKWQEGAGHNLSQQLWRLTLPVCSYISSWLQNKAERKSNSNLTDSK